MLADASAVASLTAKVARLEEARLLRRGISVEYATAAYQSVCEGMANLEMRGAIMRMLPEQREEETWTVAMASLIRGLTRSR